MGCNDFDCYSTEIIGTMVVSWAKIKVLTFGNIEFSIASVVTIHEVNSNHSVVQCSLPLVL